MNRGLLATKKELARLRNRIGRKPFDHIYDILQKRCSLILESAPITETMWRSAWEQGRWGAATSAVASIQGRLFDLIIAYHVDENTAYRDRAIEELRNLVRFSTWVDPSHKDISADLCTGEACVAVAVAVDWLAEELEDSERQSALGALREKGIGPYLRALQAGAFWQSCYHNWNAVVNAGVGLGALLLADEDEDAAAALAAAQERLGNFFQALGREGGWDEGLGYWGYAMRYVLLLGEALARVRDDSRIFRQRGMEATGEFPIYFSPHGLAVSFGDRPEVPAWGVFYLLVKHYGLKAMLWWLDRYGLRHDVTTGGYSAAGLSLLFRPPRRGPAGEPRLSEVKAFSEIGWAAAADRWPMPGMYVALKTGDLAANHAQLDMNSVQVMVDGEILLHDPGDPGFSYEYLFSKRRYGFYEVQARSHNTLTAAGREHRIDAVGSIIEARRGANYRWLAGDGGGALGEDVRFYRHVIMPVDRDGEARAVVVLDEVRNVVPEEIHLTWHTPGKVTVQEGGLAGSIAGRSAALHFAFAGDCPLEMDTSHTRTTRRQTDHTILVTTPARRDLLLLSAFARRPVRRITLRRADDGGLYVRLDSLGLHWRPSRKHLRLHKAELRP